MIEVMDDVEIGWKSRGYLPHLELGQRAQFLTWRLDDSVAAELVQRWREEIARALEDESDRTRELHRRLERYLDEGHGSCVLRQTLVAMVVQDALIFHHERLYTLHEWVVMPNHVHVLLTPNRGARLARIVHANKSFTSKEIQRLLGGEGRLWQPEYYDRFIRDDEHFYRVGKYIRWNPVKARLCADPKHWPYSSASYVARARLEGVGDSRARRPEA